MQMPSVANALNSENPLRFRVLGFVDNKKTPKLILGLPYLTILRVYLIVAVR
jgi:hypothetical protein